MLAKTIPFFFRQPVLEDVSLAELQRAVEKYPYSSSLQLLLLKKLQQQGDPEATQQWEKCSLFFPNPFLLQSTLDGYGTTMTLPAIPVVSAIAEVVPALVAEELTVEPPAIEAVLVDEPEPEPEVEPVEAAGLAEADDIVPSLESDEWTADPAINEPADEIVPNLTSDELGIEPQPVFVEEIPAPVAAEPADDIVPSLSSDEWSLDPAINEPADDIVPSLTAEELGMEPGPVVSTSPELVPEPEPEPVQEIPAEVVLAGEATPADLYTPRDIPVPADLRTELLLRESPIPIPSLKDIQPQIDDQPLFEPYHTIDYFASQGIKLGNNLPPNDKLGRQMKSFTDWIRSMKKLPQAGLEKKLLESTAGGEKIVAMAAGSIKPQEVTTETMAEVLVKQGNIDKAVEIFRKLSLAYPHKSVYFASRIEQIKKD